MAKLESSDIQNQLPAIVWQLLTKGDADIGAQALQAARAFLEPRLGRIERKLDEEDPTHRRAVYLITVYQLYARVEREAVARDKLREAIELLEALYGKGSLGEKGIATDADEESESGTYARRPTAAVVEGKNNWRGYK